MVELCQRGPVWFFIRPQIFEYLIGWRAIDEVGNPIRWRNIRRGHRVLLADIDGVAPIAVSIYIGSVSGITACV